LAGTGIEIGCGPSLGALQARVHLGLGDHDAVGIDRTGDLALELGERRIHHDGTVGVVDDAVALPIVESHLPGAQAELGLRLAEGHFSGRNLVLQRLGHTDQQINRGM
jgi:hypothetical protein